MTNTKTRKRRPTVAIIGAGRLGQALAIALHSAGYTLVALVARRRQKAEKAVALLGDARPGPLALTMKDLGLLARLGSSPTVRNGVDLPVADLIIIATPDDAIAETAELLATRETQRLATREPGRTRTLKDRTVLHTSGALASDVLRPLAKIGFHTGSLHPLVSVSEPCAGARGLHGAFYCLEGDSTALRIARTIVKDLQSTSFSIQPESKALYHAAALLAAGHLTALFDLATELLASCGPKESLARAALLALVESAVGNLQVSAPEKALTGTFARGDVATVRRHLAALSAKNNAGKKDAGKMQAEALAVYKLLGLRSLQLAAKNNLDPGRVKQIRTLLKSQKESS
jgi:predicted short-subunit dehydrogenase-like oxidoreductase (DUF2520 family)